MHWISLRYNQQIHVGFFKARQEKLSSCQKLFMESCKQEEKERKEDMHPGLALMEIKPVLSKVKANCVYHYTMQHIQLNLNCQRLPNCSRVLQKTLKTHADAEKNRSYFIGPS